MMNIIILSVQSTISQLYYRFGLVVDVGVVNNGVSSYLCTLTSAGLVGIESSRIIYVPTVESLFVFDL